MKRSPVLDTRCYCLFYRLNGFRLIHDAIRRQRSRFLPCRIEGLLHRADGTPLIEENRLREFVEKIKWISVIYLNGLVSVAVCVFDFE